MACNIEYGSRIRYAASSGFCTCVYYGNARTYSDRGWFLTADMDNGEVWDLEPDYVVDISCFSEE